MSVIFYYDVVCPFAYMASHLVEAAVSRAGGKVHWTPVLLGGLYKETEAPQGKDGSSMDVMAASKLNITNEDFRRQLNRYGLHAVSPHHQPQRTLTAMRILAGIDDQQERITLSKAFYKAYWQEGLNMELHTSLQTVIDKTLPGLDVNKMATDPLCSKRLKDNTQEASSRGVFGVPSFYFNGHMFWGVDRLHFVERLLGRKEASPERLALPKNKGTAQLTFYFDYSSPWSYLGNEQLDAMIASVQPMTVQVTYVPILLGALFKKIRTPLIPLQSFAPAKQRYLSWELQHFASEAKVSLQFPDFFPLRSVLPLRATLAARNDPHLIKILYRAVWKDNRNISEPAILQEILEENGFSSSQLMKDANSQSIKDELFANTEKAVQEGVCGVPSFQVNRGPIIWGQDRLHVVADMCCGWNDSISNSKL